MGCTGSPHNHMNRFVVDDIRHELSLQLSKEVVRDGRDLGPEDKACVKIR